jgi:hypothetical protein
VKKNPQILVQRRNDLSIISGVKYFLLKFPLLGRFDNFDDQFDKNFLVIMARPFEHMEEFRRYEREASEERKRLWKWSDQKLNTFK